MADPVWFFSTLAQAVASAIGFTIAVVMGIYNSDARSSETISKHFLQTFIRRAKHLFFIGVVVPMVFLITLPTLPDILRVPYVLLTIQLTLLGFVGYLGWRVFHDFETLATAIVGVE